MTVVDQANSHQTLPHVLHKSESVDSLCRDGTDTPYTQYKIKPSKSLQKITSKLFIGT